MKSEKKWAHFLKNILFIKKNFLKNMYKLFCGELHGSPFLRLKATKVKFGVVYIA